MLTTQLLLEKENKFMSDVEKLVDIVSMEELPDYEMFSAFFSKNFPNELKLSQEEYESKTIGKIAVGKLTNRVIESAKERFATSVNVLLESVSAFGESQVNHKVVPEHYDMTDAFGVINNAIANGKDLKYRHAMNKYVLGFKSRTMATVSPTYYKQSMDNAIENIRDCDEAMALFAYVVKRLSMCGAEIDKVVSEEVYPETEVIGILNTLEKVISSNVENIHVGVLSRLKGNRDATNNTYAVGMRPTAEEGAVPSIKISLTNFLKSVSYSNETLDEEYYIDYFVIEKFVNDAQDILKRCVEVANTPLANCSEIIEQAKAFIMSLVSSINKIIETKADALTEKDLVLCYQFLYKHVTLCTNALIVLYWVNECLRSNIRFSEEVGGRIVNITKYLIAE